MFALQRTAALQHSAPRCNTVHRVATQSTALQHSAPQCTALQHSAPRCNTVHHAHTAADCRQSDRKIRTGQTTPSARPSEVRRRHGAVGAQRATLADRCREGFEWREFAWMRNHTSACTSPRPLRGRRCDAKHAVSRSIGRAWLQRRAARAMRRARSQACDTPCHSAPSATSAPDWAHPCHICNGTWSRPGHICTGTWPDAVSATGSTDAACWLRRAAS
jgi:hypothetical protein